jgi:DNA-binding transcriptional MerR regulator
MDKANGAYRTISEVAEELDIPQHVLRFWETRFPQIKPMKRSGGRRYYRPGDVLLLRGISRLLYGEGYTIKGVQRILSAQGIGVVQQAGGGSGEELVAVDLEGLVDPAVAASQIEEPVADELLPEPDGEDESVPLDERVHVAGAPPAEDAADLADSVARGSSPPLSSDHRRLLQSALEELLACARHLDAAREVEQTQRALPGEA